METQLNNDYFTQVKASFTSYINVVIKNASINFKKKNGFSTFIELEYNDKTLEDISLLSNSDISFFCSIEENYSYIELENYFSSHELYSIVKKLPICYKKVLYYKFVKNYNYKLIATLMKTSEANIRNIKSRAIKKIKNSIKERDLYGK